LNSPSGGQERTVDGADTVVQQNSLGQGIYPTGSMTAIVNSL